MKRLTICELARELGRSRTYVHAMKAAGFKMPGRMATVGEAIDFLRDNPEFSTTGYVRKGKEKPEKLKS